MTHKNTMREALATRAHPHCRNLPAHTRYRRQHRGGKEAAQRRHAGARHQPHGSLGGWASSWGRVYFLAASSISMALTPMRSVSLHASK